MFESKKHHVFLIFLTALSFTWRIDNKLLSIIVTIVVATLWICIYIYWTLTSFFIWPSSILNLISQINIFVFFITGLTLWITGYKYNNRIYEIKRHLKHVDRELKMKSKFQLQIVQYGFIWLSFICCSFVSLISNWRTQGILKFEHYGLFFTYFIPVCAYYSLFIVFVSVVEAVRLRLLYIINQIDKLNRECNYLQRNSKLVSLKCAHLKLCHVVNLINEKFGVSIFVVVAALTVQLLTSIYIFAFSLKCLGFEAIYKHGVIELLIMFPKVFILGYISRICEITTNTVFNHTSFI